MEFKTWDESYLEYLEDIDQQRREEGISDKIVTEDIEFTENQSKIYVGDIEEFMKMFDLGKKDDV